MELVLADPSDLSMQKLEYDSFFRGIGCVSLCDLRSVKDEELETALDRYFFLDPRSGDSDPAFLILDPSATARIITYKQAMARGAISKMIVPYIEAGYQGDLPLGLIREILMVEVDRLPPDSHLAALRSLGGPT